MFMAGLGSGGLDRFDATGEVLPPNQKLPWYNRRGGSFPVASDAASPWLPVSRNDASGLALRCPTTKHLEGRRDMNAWFKPVAMAALLTAVLFSAHALRASEITEQLAGNCPDGQPVSFEVRMDFTPTGGDFATGTGSGIATITLENTSGLVPLTSPAAGNPVLSGFYFGLPPGVAVSYVGAQVLAGSTIYSTGTKIGGVPLEAGCEQLTTDVARDEWYAIDGSTATGKFGIFSNVFNASQGIKAGLVDPSVFVNCVAQGDVVSPLVIAGRLQIRLALSNLDESLDAAADFRNFCTVRPVVNDTSTFVGKFQGTGPDGEGCYINTPCAVATDAASWSSLKARF
jgi:hypothetical protein